MAKKFNKTKDKAAPVEPEVLPAQESPKERSASKALFSRELTQKEASSIADSLEELAPSISSSKALVPSTDSIQAYMRQLRRLPPLTKEEEKELAIAYRDRGDLEAAYTLVVRNLRLVVSIAKEYQKAAKNLMDLVQEGNIGLMEAVKNFDPYKNVRFPSYAIWWIRAYMIRYLMANWRMVKIGTTQAQRKLFFNLNKEKERLEREGFVPTTKLLAEKLDVKESEVIEMEQRMGSADASIDSPFDNSSESNSNLHEVLPALQPSGEELLAEKQRQILLEKSFRDFAHSLDDREKKIFNKRLTVEKKATLQELSDEFGVSKERVRQLETRIMKKLEEYLVEKLGEDVADLHQSEDAQ